LIRSNERGEVLSVRERVERG